MIGAEPDRIDAIRPSSAAAPRIRRFLRLLALMAVAGSAIGGTTATAAPKWFDRSHAIFLPAEMSGKLGATQSFPLFWWNFLILDDAVADGAPRPEVVRPVCDALKSAADSPLAKIACGADVSAFLTPLRDWARDYPLRHAFPGRAELRRKFSETFAQATLPMSRELLGVFREDPLASYAELKAILESQVKMDLPNQAGIFVDAETKRVVIPVQFKTPPSDTAATARFYALLDAVRKGCGEGRPCVSATLIGPHASTFANERQVQHDVEKVSFIGFLLTGAQILFLLFSKRARALWLFPPVLLATAVAGAVTVAVFGSIHGLTVAFGTGLIGLAIDYGLHSAFNVSFRGVWRANLCGILTTVAGFGVMLASGVPLLRQLMVFAIVGLVVTYFLFYFLHVRYGSFFAIAPFRYEPRVTRAKTALIGLVLAAAVPAALLLRPNLDMAQFDFQSPHDAAVRNWVYPHLGVKASLLDLDGARTFDEALTRAHASQEWADANRIGFQSVARFLPSPAESAANLATWTKAFCAPNARPFADELTGEERTFFGPALGRFECAALRRLGEFEADARDFPAYLRDFRAANGDATGGFISVWLPRDDAETARVKAVHPEALSLREVVEIFPRTLSGELRWMGPLSILLATFFLFLYYRTPGRTLLALVPFFCAAGVYALGVFAFGLHFSFISLIALLMIFGFSIDYGVFAVDVTLHPEGRSVHGVWTCLLFAAVATGLGFVPLLLCRHPVLAHLGQTLTLGTIGTAIGTLWGIPGIARLGSARRRAGGSS